MSLRLLAPVRANTPTAERKAVRGNELILLDLIQQVAVADAEHARSCFAVPMRLLERVGDGVTLGFSFRVANQRFQWLLLIRQMGTDLGEPVGIRVPRFAGPFSAVLRPQLLP